MQKKTFQTSVKQDLAQLDLYTKAITQAHGKSHPEAFKVRELFEKIQAKVHESDTKRPDLDSEFIQLRIVTENYQAPKGVCGTYVGTYTMLENLDQSYYAE